MSEDCETGGTVAWLGELKGRATGRQTLKSQVTTDIERATGWIVSFTKSHARIVVQREKQ